MSTRQMMPYPGGLYAIMDHVLSEAARKIYLS